MFILKGIAFYDNISYATLVTNTCTRLLKLSGCSSHYISIFLRKVKKCWNFRHYGIQRIGRFFDLMNLRDRPWTTYWCRSINQLLRLLEFLRKVLANDFKRARCTVRDFLQNGHFVTFWDMAAWEVGKVGLLTLYPKNTSTKLPILKKGLTLRACVLLKNISIVVLFSD